MFQVGDIVGFKSPNAGKHKFHLCVHPDGRFLFLNTPRAKPGEFLTPCSNVPGVAPTSSGMSAVSMTLLMTVVAGDLQKWGACKVGKMPVGTLRDLLVAVENSPLLTPEEKDAIIDGLGDYVGI